MTPAQLRALLVAATKRPWIRFHDTDDKPCRCHCGQIWSTAARDGEGELLFVPAVDDDGGKMERVEDGRAIVATMNAADALVALWEAAVRLRDDDLTAFVASHESFCNALRRLEELP